MLNLDFDSLLNSAIAAAGTGAVLLVVARAWLNGLVQEVRDARNEVRVLRDEKVRHLEERLKKMEDGCVGVKQQEALSNLVGWMKKIDLKLDRIGEDLATAKADVVGKGKWLENLDKAYQEHARDHRIHGVHHDG
jgi:hypothetical protein